MSTKVSVIIPVFNAEPHLERCIESLLGQTLQDCEFIFINDGSKDKSLWLIENYKKKDSRIVLINQENQGVSIARNVGLEIATGEYIGFVDADDYIAPNMYESLYQETRENQCDAIISNLSSELEGLQHINKFPFIKNKPLEKDYIKKEIIPFLIKTDGFNSVCNKIFNKKILKENHIEFPKNLALGEDGVFNLRFFSYARSVKYIDQAFYHYKEVDGSATRNLKVKDYFKSAVETYLRDISEVNQILGHAQIQRLKAIKLIQNVMSYIHVYFNPTKELSWDKRYQYVKHMVGNPYVGEALMICKDELFQSMGRYEKTVLQLIYKKFTFGLYCLTAYSRYRNK